MGFLRNRRRRQLQHVQHKRTSAWLGDLAFAACALAFLTFLFPRLPPVPAIVLCVVVVVQQVYDRYLAPRQAAPEEDDRVWTESDLGKLAASGWSPVISLLLSTLGVSLSVGHAWVVVPVGVLITAAVAVRERRQYLGVRAAVADRLAGPSDDARRATPGD